MTRLAAQPLQVDAVLDSAVSINLKNVRSDRAVKLLSNRLGYGFSYDATLLVKKQIDVSSSQQKVRNILYQIFGDTSLHISTHNRQILIARKYLHYAPQPCEGEAVISGTIYDNLTDEPIPFTALNLESLNRYTVANYDGIFVFKVPCDVDSIEIETHALGYINLKKNISVKNGQLSIFLEPSVIALREVIVRSVDPVFVVNQSLDKRDENYLSRKTAAKVFFRETIQKNEGLVGLSEAVFQLQKESYSNSKSDRLKLIKGRKYIDATKLDTIDFKLKASLSSCLRLDVVKNLPSFYHEDLSDIYDLSYTDVLIYNDRLVYKIDFTPKEGVNEYYHSGSLYIDENDYSLIATEFVVDKKMLHRARSEIIIRKSRKVKSKLKSAKYTVHYMEIDGKYFLSYVRMEIAMRVRLTKRIRGSSYISIAEMVVNQVDNGEIDRIERHEAFKTDKIFMEEPMSYDLDFWKGYDFFPLDIPLYQSINALESILKPTHQ
ncbi:MAG: carboxypeptidase-like regulatory domain-containing protein [Cyclobacteriaceae bacterium]